MKSNEKQKFMKDPFVIFFDDNEFPDEWVISALKTNKEFREEFFSLAANHVEKGNQMSSFGWDSVLTQMPQELKDELFVYCHQARGIGNWCDDFRKVVGQETPGIAFDKSNNSADPYSDTIEEETAEAIHNPQTPFDEFDEGPYFDELERSAKR